MMADKSGDTGTRGNTTTSAVVVTPTPPPSLRCLENAACLGRAQLCGTSTLKCSPSTLDVRPLHPGTSTSTLQGHQ